VFVITDQRSPQAPAASTLPSRTAWLVLVVVVIADLMDLIDASVANLAGPSIRADLGGGQVTVQWVLSAYTAAFALGLVTSGRLGDLLGRRRLFLLGMTGFTLASLACSLASDDGRVPAPAPAQGPDPGRPDHGCGHRGRSHPGRVAAPP